MADPFSANDVLAFLVINSGTQIPFEVAKDMTLGDPLYIALQKAWENKRMMEDERFARICAVVASCNSTKKFSSDDFMLKKPKTPEEQAAETQANLDKYINLYAEGRIRS